MACLRKLCEKVKNMSPELRRYRKNWLVIYCMMSLIGVGYFIVSASLHQFVTSSSSPEDPTLQPGLGLSEAWYSWIVSISSVGEFTGAITYGILLRFFYTKHLMLVNLSVAAIGGLFYGIGKFGWMLLIGRLCIGTYQGAQMTMFRTYLGETSATVISTLPPEKRKKSTIKYNNFLVAFSVGTTFLAAGPGLAAVVAQIPHFDQFRWPGYYFMIHAAILAVLVLVLFREKRTDLHRGGGDCTIGKMPVAVPVYTLAYLLSAFFLINWSFTVLETLQNPILSDTFGLNIKYTSYVFIGTIIFVIVSNGIIYSLQKCGVDNRLICLFGFIFVMSGSILTCDWQSIRGDPCNQFSQENFITDGSTPYTCQLQPISQPGVFARSESTIRLQLHSIQTLMLNSQNDTLYEGTYTTVDPPAWNQQVEFIGTCTPHACSFFETEIINLLFEDSMVVDNSSTLVCHVPTQSAAGVLQCYFRKAELCVTGTLQMADAQYEMSGSGSGFNSTATLLNYLLSNNSHTETYYMKSDVRCSSSTSNAAAEDTTECEMLLLLDLQVNSTVCLRATCLSDANIEVSYQYANEDIWNVSQYCVQNPRDYRCVDLTTDGIDTSLLEFCEMNASCVCEAFSGPPYHCFWNPNSHLTGEYCPRCNPLCRSVDYSLTFGQFVVGLICLVLGYQNGRVTVTLVISDALGSAPQGIVMGGLVAVGAVSRFTGPLWGNAAYLAAGRRTYIFSIILISLMAVTISLFLLLYRSMKPRGMNFLVPVPGSEEEIGNGTEMKNWNETGVELEDDEVQLLDDVELNEESNGQDDLSGENDITTNDTATLLYEGSSL